MAKIWVLADDRMGNVNQCLGVAESLGQPFDRKDLAYNALAGLPNFLLGASLSGINAESKKEINAPWPDLVIAAGRRTAAVSRYIKKQSGGKTKLVQIMYPGKTGLSDFDLVAVQTHDELKPFKNSLEIIGAPHRVTDEKLSEAEQHWAPQFSHLPKPHIALIIGGATKNKVFEKAQAEQLCQQVNKLVAEKGGSVLVTTSRRTGELADVFVNQLNGPKFTFKWGDEGENPYFGYLACADYIIVSGDSVSMCCEATLSKAPVHIFAPDEMIADKHKRFHDSLYGGGFAYPFRDKLEDEKGKKLNSAHEIASVIHKII